MSKKYLIYPHNNASENTIGLLFNRNNPLFEGVSVVDFMRYKGDTNKTNAERVLDKYNQLQVLQNDGTISQIISGKKSLISEDEIFNLPINTGTTLFIPKRNFVEEVVSIKGKDLFLEQGSFNCFIADKLRELLNDKGYVQVENLNRSGREVDIEIINENVQVWIWSRALNKIINVSPFIQNITTSKQEIGSFSFNLSPITSIEDLSFVSDTDIINYFNLNKDHILELDFFYKNFQYNDVVFIRFEKLRLEEELKSTLKNSLVVSRANLPNQVWDMIGLIDKVSQNSLFGGDLEYNVNITGRDFMKLLIEDGSYFMKLRFLNSGDSNFIFGYNDEDKWFKRNFDESNNGTFKYYYFPNSARRIDDSVGFIINQLSNLGVTGGEEIFENYKYIDSNGNKVDRRTKKYVVFGDDDNVKTKVVDGVWQIIKFLFDRNLEDRRVVDASVSYVDGTILEQFNKLCQQPFVEFFGDTYKDEFNLIVRQPPFTGDMIKSFLLGGHDSRDNIAVDTVYQVLELDEKDIEGYNNLEWDSTYYSWYQLSPQDQMLGEFADLMAGGFIPIVYFERIAECFGNKRMLVNDNYLFANVISSKESEKDRNTYRRALLNDLKYVIDSNIYLPFTRRGTITLPKGDRRIKRGTFIRVNPTNEIFYVDSVSHNLTFSNSRVDRSTTLQVSRGMLEKYIWGDVGYDEDGEVIRDGGNPVVFSYFDIANTVINSKNIIKDIDTSNTEESAKYKTKKDSKYSVKIGVKNSVADRNNNPGNLAYANQSSASSGDRKGYDSNGKAIYWAKFSTPEIGFQELIRQVSLDAGRGDTIRTFVEGFAPRSDSNDTDKYIKDLSSWLKVPETTKLSSLDFYEVAKQVARKESSTTVSKKDLSIKERIDSTQNTTNVAKVRKEDAFDFSLNEDQFDFFLKRKQFNKVK